MSTFDRATRVLLGLLGTAFVVSVVHYIDNVVNYADYPAPEPGALLAPTAVVIAAAWFVFTAAALGGLWLWFRRSIIGAALAFASYSISGLIGIGHYTVAGAIGMPWWRHTHVVVDILCGIAVLGFAVWAIVRRDALRASSYAEP
ncbi:MAG TPA: hypothetical protein VJ782_06815 [Aeromicrobium sp.]|nr:hypothetical protein [Aeromicrobium sp.]